MGGKWWITVAVATCFVLGAFFNAVLNVEPVQTAPDACHQASQNKNLPTDNVSVFFRVGCWLDLHNGAVSAVATVVVAIYTMVLAAVTGRQADLTRQSIELAREEFASSHRPILTVRHLALARGPLQQNIAVAGEKIGITFIYRNVGNTACRIVSTSADIQWARTPYDLIPRITDTKSVTEPEKLEVPAGDGGMRHATSRFPIADNELSDLQRGLLTLYVLGFIDYVDTRGIKRRTSFCRRYMSADNRFVKTDSDYEYED